MKSLFIPLKSEENLAMKTAKLRQSGFGNAIARGAFSPKRRKIVRSGGFPPNEDHLDFIRSLQCILADDPRHECSGRIEAAHLGLRGHRQKAADETTVPMCVNAHRSGKFAIHKGEKTFWSYWIIPTKEFLIEKYSALGMLHGTIKADSLWAQKRNAKVGA